ncbi:MAG TPA: hypothetical protein VFX47_02610 [Gammaproteobacteria bacterium]|nr:hypothetical protein [Gammaproteobacteria bacterium]
MNTPTDDKLDAALATLPHCIEPEHDLWPGIAARIAVPRSRARAAWSHVGAAATVAIVAISIAWIMPGMRASPPEDSAIATAVPVTRVLPNPGESPRAEFAAQLASDSGLPIKSRHALLDNLHLLHDSIRRTQAAVKKYPDDINLQALLFNLYQQEARLMNEAQQAQIQTNVRTAI